MHEDNNNTKSLIMLISSALIFGTIGIFRKFIPPIGGMVDISPIVALFVLQFIMRVVLFIL